MDWSERCETLAGLAGQAIREDAHRPPHGKRASLHCNQPTPLKATKFTKQPLFISKIIIVGGIWLSIP
ncbi:hypothetical protein [Niallia nealsonii]|uniref:hypothetical protein n=1 Tax=Niallia nealsonii TaxID=115979 RepID=UPI0012FEFA7C|nr:hypothetical protein [Niallia nealsonii]